ncbi:MAG TPA: LUD domain-containing protein [Patescibacteria group bacterium]|nr:LUD domain-containing protein [Patescibacteria group bacterium]
MDYSTLASEESLLITIKSLKAHGIDAVVVDNRDSARETVLAMIPKGSEVMTMSSTTLEEVGLTEALNESGDFDSVKKKLGNMKRETQGREMQQIGAAPEWAVGSAHAVTEDGSVLIASNTGSQLPAYTYGADHVIWVVGAQKIVKNVDGGIKRIYDYVLPKESERVKEAYGMPESFVSKLLIINKEVRPGRLMMVLVKEALGF